MQLGLAPDTLRAVAVADVAEYVTALAERAAAQKRRR